jgi:hypothetical protein
MRRLVLAAAISAITMSVAGCNQNPVSADAAVALRKAPPPPPPSPATVCRSQRLAVYSLMLRVQYYTTGDLRATLMGQLQQAYSALDPLACRPADAISSLEQFIAAVTANSPPNSSAISRLRAIEMIALANWIINNLRPIVV